MPWSIKKMTVIGQPSLHQAITNASSEHNQARSAAPSDPVEFNNSVAQSYSSSACASSLPSSTLNASSFFLHEGNNAASALSNNSSERNQSEHSSSRNSSPLNLRQYYPSSSGSSTPASQQANRQPFCVHHNSCSKCENCNSTPVYSKSNQQTSSPHSSFYSNFAFPSFCNMNSLNTEMLLGQHDKHLFGTGPGTMSMGIGGNLSHLGSIGTSIAAGISSGMNTGLSMANSHMHHSHHHHAHANSHQLHSMAAPSFALHGHLSQTLSHSQRRMSHNSLSPMNRSMSNKNNSNNSSNNKTFRCSVCNKLFTQKGMFVLVRIQSLTCISLRQPQDSHDDTYGRQAV